MDGIDSVAVRVLSNMKSSRQTKTDTSELPCAKAKTSDPVYEVAYILNHRWVEVRRGRWPYQCLQFLTVYSGYEDLLPTWQPVEDFMDRGHIVNSVVLTYLRCRMNFVDGTM